MNFEEDFHLAINDIESNREVLNAALDYLVSVKNKEDLLEDKKGRNALGFIAKLTSFIYYRDTPRPTEVFIEKNFNEVLIIFIQKLGHLCDCLKTGDDHSTEMSQKLDAELKHLFLCTQDLCNFLVSSNLMFRMEFFQQGGARAIFRLLNNQEFVEAFHRETFFDTIVMNINWLSKDADSFKADWLDPEMNAVDTILRIANNYPICKLPAYMAFANIASDKQIETLSNMNDVINELIKYTKRAAQAIMQSGVHLHRGSQQFVEDETTPTEYAVYYVEADGYRVQYSITGILLGLYRLSINNTIKYDLYVKYNLKDYLKTIIMKGSEIEAKYTLQLFAQLCFDNLVLDMAARDDDLKHYIESKTKPENCDMKTMRKLCEQITWAITMKNKKITDEASQQQSTQEDQQKQVMISYNCASRDLCLKIKEELEKRGYRVWIDVSQIHSSSLETMARAVESSDFILMIITEKYRQSINCQAEAQYAFKLKKKIIPLIMQKGYENVDGWLGLIMGDKIFVNFNMFPFEHCIQIMLKQLNLTTTAAVASAVDPVKMSEAPVKVAATTELILKWSEQDVENWFREKCVNRSISEIMKPCDGELLHQFYTLQVSAPEFFYQSITKDSSVDLRTALVFALNLKKLFEQ